RVRGRGSAGRSARILSTCVILAAAGSGTRLGGDEPKAFVRVNGRSLLTRSLEAIDSSGVASAVVVVAPEEFLVRAREEISAITENGESGMSITAVAGEAIAPHQCKSP